MIVPNAVVAGPQRWIITSEGAAINFNAVNYIRVVARNVARRAVDPVERTYRVIIVAGSEATHRLGEDVSDEALCKELVNRIITSSDQIVFVEDLWNEINHE